MSDDNGDNGDDNRYGGFSSKKEWADYYRGMMYPDGGEEDDRRDDD